MPKMANKAKTKISWPVFLKKAKFKLFGRENGQMATLLSAIKNRVGVTFAM